MAEATKRRKLFWLWFQRVRVHDGGALTAAGAQLEQKVDGSDLPTINMKQRDIKRHARLAMNPAQLPSDDILPASSSKIDTF